ncbi:hypothetical protein FO440_12075 [Mucilaginibacter corticis]|uniref:Uncharacterized protein n=1 Tax=Mucilaginibacter corticis TaxID=2597670 RepID=A0A556MKP1_9SPHI|nr:hypothetical protein [Mucilaginibacter corticis]TSJ40487.1 hypothetical protein FO440_12075 [Mucilaginibacter corticis]
MSALKLKYILVFAMLMVVAKPFVGFSLRYQHYFESTHHRSPNILVKSFTKRKQEYADEHESNISKIQQRLANPVLPLVLILAFAIALFLPALFRFVKNTTQGILTAIRYSLTPPEQLYLLGGKLTI